MDRAGRTASLSARELQIARAYTAGGSYRDIAAQLFIAPSTVRTHLSRIYRKLEVSSKLELMRILEAPGDVDEVHVPPGDTPVPIARNEHSGKTFAEVGIDRDAPSGLTEETLKELGVPLGEGLVTEVAQVGDLGTADANKEYRVVTALYCATAEGTDRS